MADEEPEGNARQKANECSDEKWVVDFVKHKLGGIAALYLGPEPGSSCRTPQVGQRMPSIENANAKRALRAGVGNQRK